MTTSHKAPRLAEYVFGHHKLVGSEGPVVADGVEKVLFARMGWEIRWYIITDSFDTDFRVDEWHGHNAFIRDGERAFRTYFTNGRGDEAWAPPGATST